MLTSEQIDQAARHLLIAHTSKTPGALIPEGARPQDADSALAIQQRTLELLGENTGGWKCGVPNPAGMIFSPIAASRIVSGASCAVPPPIGLIEPEIAFVMARDLPPRATPYDDAEIREAIGEARMVLELIHSRYADRPAATPIDLLADMYNNYGLLVGPVISNVFEKDLAKLPVTVRAGEQTLLNAERPHPSGGPLKAITWLVHFLNERGQGLRAGQVITTGSYAGIVQAPIGPPIYVELAGVGVIETALLTA